MKNKIDEIYNGLIKSGYNAKEIIEMGEELQKRAKFWINNVGYEYNHSIKNNKIV
jgi:hypothetical protein